jgi:hypothetical protein
VASWLQEVGRRRAPEPRADSHEELHAHLESLAGRKLRTREDVSEYVKALSRRGEKGAGPRGGRSKNLFLGVLLIVAILQYYFIDVQLQILKQPSLMVFVPVKPPEGGGRS